MMKQKLLYGLAAALVIAGGGYLLLNSGNEATAPVTQNTNIETPLPTDIPASTDQLNTNSSGISPNTPPTKNTLVLSTQLAGPEITIDNVYLEQPGFIVIHEIKNDAPSTVIGSSGWLSAGPGQDISFKANLKAGSTYFALLYQDNGDKKFNIASDKKLPLFSLQSDSYNDKGVVQFTVVK